MECYKENKIRNIGKISQIRKQNSMYLLNLIREYHPVSRDLLAKKGKMSKATITRITSNMLKREIITESERVDTPRGRKPVLLSPNLQKCLLAGIFITPSYTDIGIMDINGNVIAEKKIKTYPEEGADLTFKRIKEIKDLIIKSRNISSDQIMGYGIAIPGFVNIETTSMDVSVSLGWKSEILIGSLEKFLGERKIYIDGLSEAVTQNEYYFGWPELRQPNKSILFLIASEGIAATFMFDGKIYRGHNNDVGDLGHIPSLRGGPVCRCGNRGCPEASVSEAAIIKRLKSLYSDLGSDQGYKNKSDNDLLSDLLQGKIIGKEFEDLVDDISLELAWVILVGIKCYDPSCVVVGGSVFMAGGQFLIKRTRDQLKKMILHESGKKIQFLLAKSSKSNVVAAASIAYRTLFGPLSNS